MASNQNDDDQHKKLWEVSNAPALHPLVESFTVGDDYILDTQLLPYDLQGTLAHGEMLHTIGLLDNTEVEQLREGLLEISRLYKEGNFHILRSDEDCHTAIENFLTNKYGVLGQKIHTGRSRNDQVMTMIRLFEISRLRIIIGEVKELVSALREKSELWKVQKMPGYTHFQRAMPTTVGIWLDAYRQAFEDQIPYIEAAINLIDQNPLGSAAGYGVPHLNLDRELTTKKLGFSKVQQNTIYCAMSRGLFEGQGLNTLWGTVVLTGRLAQELLFFTMEETAFFSLDQSFTTGSSIMPQKRNYDVFEIMRGNVRLYGGLVEQIMQILPSVGSGYSRDLQITKKPFVEGMVLCSHQIQVLTLSIKELKCRHELLDKAMSPDLYATERVYQLVSEGLPFRAAYNVVKKELVHFSEELDEKEMEFQSL